MWANNYCLIIQIRPVWWAVSILKYYPRNHETLNKCWVHVDATALAGFRKSQTSWFHDGSMLHHEEYEHVRRVLSNRGQSLWCVGGIRIWPENLAIHQETAHIYSCYICHNIYRFTQRARFSVLCYDIMWRVHIALNVKFNEGINYCDQYLVKWYQFYHLIASTS